MGRPRKHLVQVPHPSPRFRDKIRLSKRIRGANDETWNAEFLIDGIWVPGKPVSLSTKDWDEACENAREKYAAVLSPVFAVNRQM
jgi:hypothetical protein